MNIENQSNPTFLQRMKNSVTAKMTTVGVLILVLLIPMGMIKSIIRERNHSHLKTVNEVSNKWAGEQQITGPVLSIPIIYKTNSNGVPSTKRKFLHVLPENLKINGKITPENRTRGAIYKVMVYKGNFENSGVFELPDLSEYGDDTEIHLNKAFITLGVSDLKGIKNDIILNWNNTKIKVQPGSKISHIIDTGLTIPLPDLSELNSKPINFNYNLQLHGSQKISFIPVGSTTDVSLTSAWKDPSYFGNYIPDAHKESNEGFSANWKVLQLNRNFPKTFTDENPVHLMKKAAFGVELKQPMDDHQKAMRSAKYAILILGLTFLIFFLVEVINRKRVHPLQYILVGLALCLFYVLLVSISEHSNFNFAYLIASGAVVTVITLYATSVFKDYKLAGLIFGVLSGVYACIFVILQLADYALLMGSIGLTAILALTMYFTRNINWYTIHFDKK